MAKPKRPKHISPRGIALFPWLNKADSKFPPAKFKVTLRVPADKAEEFIKQIDANTEAYRAEAMEMLKDPKLKASFKKAGKIDAKGNPHVHAPYSEVLNDAGDATGEIDFAFSCPEAGQDKKTGKTWVNKIVMFNADKKDVTGVAVWGGSEIKVRCTMNAYLTVLAGLGTSLRMDAVQIFKLSKGNGATADGFDEEEGEEIEAPSADEGTPGASAPVGDEEF